jgi:BirA family biotin operon repressor/biotin-[acetyl-CoA-carboxylase] ligase
MTGPGVRDVLDEQGIRAALAGSRLAREVHVFDEVKSTNDEALSLARGGAGEGNLVVADRQAGGRGRLGRPWHSAPGLGLWFSLVLRPALDVRRSALVSLAGALGIATALRQGWGVRAGVKWPNDVVAGGRKLCGLLCEGEFSGDSVRFLVLGIGLNALHGRDDFPADLAGKATSVALEGGREVRRLELLSDMVRAVEAKYFHLVARGFDDIRRELLLVSPLVGKVIRVATGDGEFEGTAVDLDEDGALVLRLESGRLKSIVAGEVVRVT